MSVLKVVCKLRFRQFVDDICILINLIFNWQITHINRVVNFASHGLVKVTVKHVINQI